MAIRTRATKKASRQPVKTRSKTKRLGVDPISNAMAELMLVLEYSYMILLEDIYRSSRGNQVEFTEKCQRLLMPVIRDSEKVDTLTAKLWTAFSRANRHLSKNKKVKSIITGGAAPFAPGGPYLQRLTEKGDKPITGYDFAKALDEMMTMMSSLQYTKDFSGRPLFLSDVTRGLDWFRGNDWSLKYYVRNYWARNFYSLYPPSINIGEILSRWDNIVDYLNMYTDDKRIRREYANEMGYPVKETEKDRFLQAFARKYDMADRMFMQTRNRMNLRNLMI